MRKCKKKQKNVELVWSEPKFYNKELLKSGLRENSKDGT